MAIPSVDEIYKKAEEYGVKIIEGSLLSGEETAEVFIRETQENALEKFMDILKQLNKTHFFLFIEHWEQEDLEAYTIDIDSITEDEYGEACSKIKRKAKKYNTEIMASPIDKPVTTELFACADGVVYRLKFVEEWIYELDAEEDALDNICKDYEHEINSYLEEQRKSSLEISQLQVKERQQTRKILTNELAKDQVFRSCTTKAARLEYTMQFLTEKDSPAFSKADAEGIAELAWTLYKSK